MKKSERQNEGLGREHPKNFEGLTTFARIPCADELNKRNFDMKTTLYSLIFLVMTGLTATSAEAKKDAEQPKTEAAERKSRPSEPVYDLEFPGGTLAQFIDAVHGQSGEKPNVLIPTEGLSLAVPKLELRAVTTANVMESLGYLLIEEYGYAFRRMGAGWVLTSRPDRRKAQAFYVGHLLGKFKIQDITTAIETTWRPSSKSPKPELKFHEDTQLLIAYADSSLIEVVTNVLDQLQQAVGTKIAASPDPKASSAKK